MKLQRALAAAAAAAAVVGSPPDATAFLAAPGSMHSPGELPGTAVTAEEPAAASGSSSSSAPASSLASLAGAAAVGPSPATSTIGVAPTAAPSLPPAAAFAATDVVLAVQECRLSEPEGAAAAVAASLSRLLDSRLGL